jgi:hypothetical protein
LKDSKSKESVKTSEAAEDDWDLDDDSDDVEDRKLTQAVEKKAREIESKVEEKFDRLEKIKSERNRYDNLAFNTYPELHDPASKFGKAVQAEIDLLVNETISTYGLKTTPEQIVKNDPRILWTASARVAAKSPEFRDKALVDTVKQQLAKQDGSHGFRPRERAAGGPSQNQISYAQRLGLSPERLAGQMKKRGF